jgi:hypothetical protein
MKDVLTFAATGEAAMGLALLIVLHRSAGYCWVSSFPVWQRPPALSKMFDCGRIP